MDCKVVPEKDIKDNGYSLKKNISSSMNIVSSLTVLAVLLI